MGYVFVVLFFFVFLCGFVLDCGILVMFLPHCIVYYRVPDLHYSGGLIGTVHGQFVYPRCHFPCEYLP